ncbi:MAG: thiamine phosphate synthase, partial [Campylobacter sp.]|nr:thiamine phosphate synthase [Campylobacter sp.]
LGKDYFLERIRKLCEVGVDAILLRAKFLQEQEFYALAVKAKEICDRFGVEFIVNQFFNAAFKLKSCFWITSDELTFIRNSSKNIAEFGLCVTKLQSLKTKIYAPAHDIKEAKISALFADILVVSHIFDTACKVGKKPAGLNLITRIKEQTNKNIYALGGITQLNFNSVLDLGASGICLMSSAMTCSDVNKFITAFRSY